MRANDNNCIIKDYLEREFKLPPEQLRYELDRFVRHPDIGAELEAALRLGEIPPKASISVRVGDANYTASMLYQSRKAQTIYGAYSILTQLRDRPELAARIMEGIKIK